MLYLHDFPTRQYVQTLSLILFFMLARTNFLVNSEIQQYLSIRTKNDLQNFKFYAWDFSKGFSLVCRTL